ncbi:DUF6236 family protein [Evansella clarkii]|uniref:DUF6236 family protein n=1 Tax=Evansella clarkii TaxID=79879 RepID=UPI000995F9CF|nr:DUF6236 family protein [Evansella clarkii]
MRQMLYYPKIILPVDWMKKTMLYSDKIASIHPMNVSGIIKDKEEEMALANMEYLESEGIYEYIRPEDLDWKIFKNLLKDLQSIMDQDNSLKYARENFRKQHNIYEIFRSKMSEDITRYLFENDLARINKENLNSIIVEGNVGLLYMSLLAQHTTSEKRDYTTSTNKIEYQNILFERSDSLYKDYNLNLVIENLPTPSSTTSLEDIIAFKKERRDELLLFRRYINDWVDKINSNPSNINRYKDDYELHLKDVCKLMGEYKIPIQWSTLEITIPTLATSIAHYVNENNFDIYSPISAISSLGINYVRSKFMKESITNKDPLTYIQYLKQEL